ncbi:MAG: type II toxin-antitoxin system VapC family toxin [Terracidiphilus sp.]
MILDTNALSAAAEQHAGIAEILSTMTDLEFPVIVLGEFRSGIAQSRHRAEYSRWLDDLIVASRVLDVTESTTHHYAAIRLELKRDGKPIPTNDLWIAALCRQHHLPLLSQDHHFDAVEGLKRLGW